MSSSPPPSASASASASSSSTSSQSQSHVWDFFNGLPPVSAKAADTPARDGDGDVPRTSAELQSTPTPPSLFCGPVPLHADENRASADATRAEAARMRTLIPSELGWVSMYKLMIGAVVPRPIAWVSSQSAAGVVNLAPMSFFQAVCPDPPTLIVSITRKGDGGKKDTLRNIEETGDFVVNTVSEWTAEQMNDTSASLPYGVSELEKAGLTAVSSLKVRPPRVGEAAVAFECVVQRVVEVGEGTRPGNASVVFGTIVCVHVREGVLSGDDHIRIDRLRPIARLGQRSHTAAAERLLRLPVPAHRIALALRCAVCAAGNGYSRVQGTFDLVRPK